MKASQSVYLTEDRKSAVAEGDPKARFLLVREGQEIEDARVDAVEGAAALVGGKKKAAAKEDDEKPAKAKAKH